jgi:hypothetical protein
MAEVKERFDLFCRAERDLVIRLDEWTARSMPNASRSAAIRTLLFRALDEADRKRGQLLTRK